MSQSVTRLRIDDEEFLVASLIERCPKVMMLRELVQNAIDAAVHAEAGQRRIDILAVEIGGTAKLAIRNTGPGMSADELFRMCDLAASLGKQKGLNRNFGMGAKVAALPANQLGMRYRSCKLGRVHEVVIGKRNGVYGRVRRSDPLDPKLVDVIDVTGPALADGWAIDHDWTEVTLLGDHADQDTVAAPFDGDPPVASGWLAQGLYHRFYRLPEAIDLFVHCGFPNRRPPQPFHPLAARGASFERSESVSLADGTRIHYLLDPPDPDNGGRNQSEAGALQPADSTAAIVYRNEMYDVRTGWEWSQIGPRFGLAFGVQHVSVHVELADEAAVLPDAYRQFLRHAGGEQRQLEITDFAASISVHRPKWLIEALRALGPDTRIAASLREELLALMKGLNIRRKPAIPSPAAAPTEEFRAEVVMPTISVADAFHTETDYAPPPEVVLLRDLRHVHDRLLDGRAACYDEASHELYVNMRYAAFTSMTDSLVEECSGQAEIDTLHAACTEAAEETLIRRIGRTLVHGLAKGEAHHNWNRWQMAAALSPEALTIAADDFIWSMPDARRQVSFAIETMHAQEASR